MSVCEYQELIGILTIVAHDGNGKLLWQQQFRNLITSGGKRLLASLLIGTSELPTQWDMVVGSGTQPADVADTALQQLVERAPCSRTRMRVDASSLNGAAKVGLHLEATLPTGNSADPPQTLSEAGILVTVGSTQTLFNRVTFDAVNRIPAISITLAWDILF